MNSNAVTMISKTASTESMIRQNGSLSDSPEYHRQALLMVVMIMAVNVTKKNVRGREILSLPHTNFPAAAKGLM